MNPVHPSAIESWHAHVYFDSSSRDAAWALRETIAVELGGRMEWGRFHEKTVGPHPMWSYQLAISAAGFSEVVGWLALNHGALDVFDGDLGHVAPPVSACRSRGAPWRKRVHAAPARIPVRAGARP